MAEEKITLDREAFRSLASGTRISILKSLDQRRKMLTELAKELDMSPSTVKEHMDSLRKAGLVILKDDGHKWKYYELTRNGKNIL
jgi:DNA-binding transcriptional ArsR family regulator